MLILDTLRRAFNDCCDACAVTFVFAFNLLVASWDLGRIMSVTLARHVAKQAVFARDFLANAPYLFKKTPEEFAREVERKRRENAVARVQMPLRAGQRIIYEEYVQQLEPWEGRVRVKLYRDLQTLHQDSPLAVDVRLEPSGELNLKLVQKEWNLQNCFVADSSRLQIFQPERPDILSGVAVRLLTDNQWWLRVIEHPSPGRIAVRRTRLWCQDTWNCVTVLWQSLRQGFNTGYYLRGFADQHALPP